MEKKNFIKIGLLAVLALVILVWGLSFLKGDSLFKAENHYVAIYNKLDGLAESNPVMLSGYRIGAVENIGFEEQDNDLKIVVKMKISNDFQLPIGTTAKIVNIDIMGTKGVEIIRPKTVNGYYSNGDTLRSAIDGGIIDQLLDFVLPMKEDLAGFLTTSDSVMHALNLLLNEKNRTNLSVSLAGLSEVADHLSKNANHIDTIMRNFDRAARMLGRNTGNIERAINNFATLSDSLAGLELAQTLHEAEEALKNANRMLKTINEGNGTAQQILTNDTLYNNLQEATVRINRILDEFEKHPKKYINLSIFGGKEKEKKKKE
ncbi:MAG: MCE family protein [Bacteroidales bacterium]|jgi:phospholipid/cholesterol/gamma-HCH transport system substrate-binding protein|nr:MCE family protein [Bacteroidales bacterium]